MKRLAEKVPRSKSHIWAPVRLQVGEEKGGGGGGGLGDKTEIIRLVSHNKERLGAPALKTLPRPMELEGAGVAQLVSARPSELVVPGSILGNIQRLLRFSSNLCSFSFKYP